MRTKLYHLLVSLVMASLFAPASAQTYELPERFDQYCMLCNMASGHNLGATQRYDLATVAFDVSDPCDVFHLASEKPFSFAEEMEKLQSLLESGVITDQEFTALFMNLMNVSSWKSGFYPVSMLESQGVDYMDIVRELPGYADKALEYFLDNEADQLYEDHYGTLLLLCVFASDVINPSNIESADAFKTWVTNYLTKWRNIMDFGLYLSPLYVIDDPEDAETMMYPTGDFHLVFSTPKYVGSMEKAQGYINSMREQEGEEPFSIWAHAKRLILQQIAIDHPEGSNEYNFLHSLLGDSEMNSVYMIGADTKNKLYIQACPDAFNTQEIILTPQDMAQCSWSLYDIDEDLTLGLPWRRMMKDSDGQYVTTYCSSFPYRLVSSGLRAYYATGVNYEDGMPQLEEIIGDIPANTPVIIKSAGNDLETNRILPLLDEVGPVAGNVLEGVLFATDFGRSVATYTDHGGVMSFMGGSRSLEANSAYYPGETAGAGMTSVCASEGVVYDMLGRRISSGGCSKGIYVIGGKKVMK